MEINEQEITFNIRYDMHEEDWKDLVEAFKLLPGWIGIEKTGEFFWLGKENDEVYIKGKITFTGFVLEANLPDIVWEAWILHFKEKTSEALGFEVFVI
ncbi:MAG: hypothetical protein HS119_10545 [Flavobacteriales bacterium]|nr:hypothetical protein [Flavobacteriales bacterium]